MKHLKFTQIGSRPLSQALPVPNVGVTISRASKSVRIRDLDRVYQDVLVQGDDVGEFMTALKQATAMMPDLPIKDALVVVTAPFVSGKWS